MSPELSRRFARPGLPPAQGVAVSVEAISWRSTWHWSQLTSVAVALQRLQVRAAGLANDAGQTGLARSRWWPRSSATPACPSAPCAPAWTGSRPGESIQACDLESSPPDQAGRPAPEGLDLDLKPDPGRPTSTEVAALGRRSPAWTRGRGDRLSGYSRGPGRVGNRPHPASAVENRLTGATCCTRHLGRVQPAHGRGGTSESRVQQLHPNRPKNDTWNRPPPPRRACEVSLASGAVGGGPAGEFFAALGDGWRLTPTQRLKLVPAVTAALERGWAPRVLAAFAGANTNGVRNPYGALTARLSPAALPPPRRPARPPWCGQCDQTTRMLGFHSDAPRPCPRCKPACTQQDRPGPRRPLPPRSPARAQASIGAPARPGIANPSQSTGKEARRHRLRSPQSPARQ